MEEGSLIMRRNTTLVSTSIRAAGGVNLVSCLQSAVTLPSTRLSPLASSAPQHNPVQFGVSYSTHLQYLDDAFKIYPYSFGFHGKD